jgi:LPPG:FO 2-phospho-L-lactate transferase
MITILTGGTGGSKLVDGLAQVVGQEHVTAIVNTADDDDFHGLRVCPDLDIVTYCLAGVVAERGWGYRDDTFRCLEGLVTYGRPGWFGLGDRDIATHIHRTLRIAEGWPLHRIVAEIASSLGVSARVLPMSDDSVRTLLRTASGTLRFEEYLVRDGAREDILEITLDGMSDATPAPGVLDSIAAAEMIVIAPSSPVVSIGTILAVPGVRDALRVRREDVVAVSPIIGDAPVEGPARRFLAGIGEHACSAPVMARLYTDVCASMLIHETDADRASEITAFGVQPVAADILMPDRQGRARLAERVLALRG